ncbi:sigma-E factor negative regulatory protein [Thiogranum longum]|jgi:sigma-E factor negative regulatory protein RseA
MRDEIREQLSALVDDELEELERPLLLGRLQRDIELRECLGRYQLIGEVMRGSGRTATLGVARRVQQVLEQEGPLPVADLEKRSGRGWWKALSGVAIAASVALVSILTVTSLRESGTENGPVLAQGPDAPVTQVSDQQWNRIKPQLDERVAGYLVNHSEYAGTRGIQGVMPYVRIVGYENNE